MMAVSLNDALIIARGLGICFQLHVPSKQIREKSDADVQHLIMMLTAEGAQLELLDCFQEFFPGGLSVTRDKATGLPVVRRGAG